MKASNTIHVRFADCDAMGHVNNAKYFTFMEQSRVALSKKLFDVKPGTPIEASHFPFILAEITCNFLAPTYVDDELTATAEVSEIKNKSFVIEYKITRLKDQTQVAKGRSVQVWYDYKNGKTQIIPDSYRQKLENPEA